MTQRAAQAAAQAKIATRSVRVLRESGLIRLGRPDLALAAARAIHTYGPVAGPFSLAARRTPAKLGLADERGQLTYRQLDRRSNALARGLAGLGARAGSVIALLARDHRGAVETMLAAGKLGAQLLPMNTGFAGPQLADVARREHVSMIVYDEEFADAVAAVPPDIVRVRCWTDGPAPAVGHLSGQESTASGPVVEQLTAGDNRPLPPPSHPGGLILLTSGTGGMPKGAARGIAKPLAVAQLLDRIPLRAGEPVVISTPLFHGTGLSQFIMAAALGSACIVRRRFDPEAALADVARYRAGTLVLVPTMLRRIVSLGSDVIRAQDTSSLRIILVAGAPLPASLGDQAMKLFGDVLHNMYGSTEVSVAAVALPADWRAAPGTVGRPPVGCRVALFDSSGRPITRPHATGRIFVASDLTFAGYTDGGGKEIIDGMICCGDLGHFDEDGRLFIDGRDDDMIISGGENVYPNEVENVLTQHDHVAEAAVVGVPDEEFGQRLKAFVVSSNGAKLEAEEIRSFVRERLARHKVPRDVVFLNELPRNSTGKLVRAKLH
jgi:fatty-acyl-CoA synthase